MRPLALTALLLAPALVAADPEPKKADKKPTITGQVEFPGKPAFPKGTVVTIQVQDVSLADAKAVVLGKKAIENPKGSPLPFEVEYDAEAAKKGVRFSLSVRVTAGGKLLYINDTHIAVITEGRVKNIKAPVIEVKR
jgi:putative lipoprotein